MDVECFNCHKMGHYASNHWGEGGREAGQGIRGKGMEKGKAKEAATVAKPKAKDEEVTWMVITAPESDLEDFNVVSASTISPSLFPTTTSVI